MVGSLSGYDIYLGVHGAELTNVLYGNQGLVLVEVMSEGWDKVRCLPQGGGGFRFPPEIKGKSCRPQPFLLDISYDPVKTSMEPDNRWCP